MAEWSDTEEAILHHAEFVAELARRQAGGAQGGGERSRFLRFLKTGGGTALVTTIVGGIFGAIISGIIQNGAKEREFEQSWLKARGDQALVAYKEYLDKEQEVVNEANALIGGCTSAADDLIEITGPNFDPNKISNKKSRQTVLDQRGAVRNTFNSVDEKWRSEQIKLGLLMNYYHGNSPEVAAGWQKVQKSVTAYLDCAGKTYGLYLNARQPADTSNACMDEKETLQQAVATFSQSLSKTRHYAWENWETPEKLKKGLEQSGAQATP